MHVLTPLDVSDAGFSADMLTSYITYPVADVEILKGVFGWHIHSAPPKAVRRAAKW